MWGTPVGQDGASPRDAAERDWGWLEKEEGLRRTVVTPVVRGLTCLPRGRRIVCSTISRLEGGVFYSYTLRRLLYEWYGIKGGAYSYGAWTLPGAMPPGLVVGRYVSMAWSVRILSRNHPYDRLSMHPFFYSKDQGYVKLDSIGCSSCWIGHDSWIGEGAIITPGCKRIGIGAVVGAGSVVTKDVPDFAVVGGSPAKVIRFRFSEETCKRVIESRWWELTVRDLLKNLDALSVPLESLPRNHSLLVGGSKEAECLNLRGHP